MKKNIKILTLLSAFALFYACSSDSCDYDTTANATVCNINDNPTEKSGFTVGTFYNSDPNGAIGKIFDTKLNGAFSKGVDLSGTIPTVSPANWTPNDLGQVFGIAIDDDENIYLATSKVYEMFGYAPSYTNPRPAQVYKCSPPTYTAIALFTLPNTGTGSLNGIGNITYDKFHKQLFTTNLEDGKIYRHKTDGTLLESFDPWTADTGTAGIVGQDERVWGIAAYYDVLAGNVKIFFPRITTGNATREIYSVTLNADGSFPTGTNPEVVEISGIPGTQLAITDIAISGDNAQMLLAERGDPHNSKVMSYIYTPGWVFDTQYFVGGFGGENSAGGVDFYYPEIGGDISSFCGQAFWATGNYMDARTNNPNKIYGIEGIQYSGNNIVSAPTPTANQDTDYFVDYNAPLGTQDKGHIGDVEVFDNNDCFDVCPVPGG